MIKAWLCLIKRLKTKLFTKQMKLFTNIINQGIGIWPLDPPPTMDEPKYPPYASTNREFKSHVPLCQTILIQMQWMDEDDMQKFGVSDLYEYVKGRENFRVWHTT